MYIYIYILQKKEREGERDRQIDRKKGDRGQYETRGLLGN